MRFYLKNDDEKVKAMQRLKIEAIELSRSDAFIKVFLTFRVEKKP